MYHLRASLSFLMKEIFIVELKTRSCQQILITWPRDYLHLLMYLGTQIHSTCAFLI